MGDFHYDDATIARGPKSQPPTTVGTHQASHSTVRSGFSLAQKTLAPPTDDDTQPSQSAPRSPDEKQHGPSATKSAGKPMPPPSVDTNNQPPPASQGVHLDTASLAAATSNNAQTQGPVHREIPPGSTHYDIRNNIVVNLTYNAPPPQMHLPEQPFKPTNGQQSGARSKAVHVDDAEERTSHNNQASSVL